MRRSWKTFGVGAFAVLLCLVMASSDVFAQGGGRGGRGQRRGRGQRLTPEQNKAAWETQAKGVSSALSLSEEAGGKLVASYTKAREELSATQQAGRGRRGGGGGGRAGGGGRRGGGGRGGRGGGGRGGGRGGRGFGGGFGAFTNPQVVEARGKLETELTAFLTGDQLKRAMVPLGAFDQNWDRMVNAIASFSLGDPKTGQALKAIEAYVIENATASAAMAGADDPQTAFQAFQTKTQAAREKLNTEIAKLELTEEQAQTFQRSIGGRRGRGRGF